MVSFGGLGLTLDNATLNRWPEHRFIVASGAERTPPSVRPRNVFPLPQGPEASGSEAPVRAAAHTKPGYSSFCEAMAQDVGPIVVKREGFAEAPALEQGLRRHLRHLEIEQASVHLGDWQLDTPLLRA